MGTLLIAMQTTEKLLQVMVDIALPKGGVIDPEEYLKKLNVIDKRTIGGFLKILRERANIAPTFDDALTIFLSMRNDLIHDVERIPGFGVNSEAELKVASDFLEKLMRYNNLVQKVIYGLGRSWQLQNGIVLNDIGNDQYTKDVDQNVVPLIDVIFTQKEK